jgi:hypothetical protein
MAGVCRFRRCGDLKRIVRANWVYSASGTDPDYRKIEFNTLNYLQK